MHLLYVDESGDTGRHNPENHTFVLCGLLVHHADWHSAQASLDAMRARMQQTFGLPRKAEIHASELLGRSALHHGMDRAARIRVALHLVEMVRREKKLKAIRITLHKQSHEGNLLAISWRRLLASAELAITSQEHSSCSAPGLIVVCDDHRTAPADYWLESVKQTLPLGALLLDEPFGRDSQASDFLQVCDMLAYLTKQTMEPNKFFKTEKSHALLRRCERLFSENNPTYPNQGKGGADAPPDRNLSGS